MSYPTYYKWLRSDVLERIDDEIERGNAKHGHAPKATSDDVVLILAEELGEYAQALLKRQYDNAQLELEQIAAIALNHLCGSGPHRSQI